MRERKVAEEFINNKNKKTKRKKRKKEEVVQCY